MTHAANKQYFALSLAAVLSHALLVPQIWMIHSFQPGTEQSEAVAFGLALYAALQLGGRSLLGLLGDRVANSIELFSALRVLGTLGLLSSRPAFLVSSFAALGFSYSIFYGLSRESAGARLKTPGSGVTDSVFRLMNLALNVAWLAGPILGIKVIQIGGASLALSASLLCSAAAIGLLVRLKPPRKEGTPSQVKAGSEASEGYGTLFADALRLLVVIVPVSALSAWIPAFVHRAGLSTENSGLMFAINSGIVIAIQFGLVRYKAIELKGRILDLVLIAGPLALLGMLESAHLGLPLIYLGLAAYSLAEAVQIPAIESKIFAERSYSTSQINLILIIDSIASFIGPWLVTRS